MKPPFRWLPVVVWVYFALCFTLHPSSLILQGNFIDSDDYLKLVQAIDWLKGQGWFDPIQHRMNPPAGVFVHFSSLFNLLYGIPIFLLQPWFGYVGAATITAAFFPLLYFALFLMAVRWAALPFVGKDWAWVTAYIALFSGAVLSQFNPGRVDHHGVELLIAITAMGASIRMMQRSDGWKWAIAAGSFLALGVSIGLEFLPVFFIASGWLGLWMIITGMKARRSGHIFSLALFVPALVLLYISRGPQHFFDIQAAAYSFVYIVLIGLVALWFLCIGWASILPVKRRVVCGGGAIFIAAAVFLFYFPNLIGGPYGVINPKLEAMILGYATEAWPLMRQDASAQALLFPIIAIVVQFRFFQNADQRHRWVTGFLFALITTTTLLAVFYQQRFIAYAQAFSIIPLTLLLKNIWAAINVWRPRSRRLVMRAAAVLMMPLIAVVIPVLTGGRPLLADIVFFPVSHKGTECPLNFASRSLSESYGSKSQTIMNTIGEGAELLFRTPHKVLAGPYHMNLEGNLDSYKFFSTYNPDIARAIVRRRNVDFVVMCRSTNYFGDEPKPADNALNFSQQLSSGKIPPWLRQIGIPGNVMLFEVKPRNRKSRHD
ncbi:MAG: hypothetical protein SFW62_09185 [Alphaproteobacteria bacterium]|nr:hypothetical protein [Alphaproteobacteria bacterium]